MQTPNITLINVVTRFENPRSMVQLREQHVMETRHWYEKEQWRWRGTDPSRFLITVVDGATGQTALCEIKEDLIFDMYHPVVLTRSVIDELDRGVTLSVNLETAHRQEI